MTRYNYTHAMEVLNQAVALYPALLPTLLEKMKMQFMMLDWEQAVETAHRWVGVAVIGVGVAMR